MGFAYRVGFIVDEQVVDLRMVSAGKKKTISRGNKKTVQKKVAVGVVVGVVVVCGLLSSRNDAGPSWSTTAATSKLVRDVIQCRHAKLITGHWQWIGQRFHDR